MPLFFSERRGQFIYWFVHDKIQDASLSLADEDTWNDLKTIVGKDLINEYAPTEKHLFVAVNNLNEGVAPVGLGDRMTLAKLSLFVAETAVEPFTKASKYSMKGIDGYLGAVKNMQRSCH